MIRVERVSLSLSGRQILDDVSLTLPRGGLTALIGPNGAGKSSLLSLIARLRPLQSGRIVIDDMPVDATPSREIAKVLAILRQEPAVASRLRVRELVGFGRFPHNRGRCGAHDRALVSAALDEFDLAELSERFVDQLSGGQRQRALTAMAFVQGTDYLLLDEPLNNLDMFYARELMRRLRNMADQNGRTVVAVLHDINQAAAYADRIVGMRDGRVIADGPPAEILNAETLQALFGYAMAVRIIDGAPVVLHHLG